ncbi:hypothetical protein FGE12_19795 [Aggregicoccus sp. 17bor-14]|uniref:hypothetical protein n=1 Tax=Myxococcaceae TaxID=31 RepID=UPI00129CF672|nr:MULTISPECIES: hypothetical protein [Myxococcaceae]MBF5044653.1 hypothetical protein [Simulacricoccus sp. 17bor-14]MRI90397.1 hypothetical protein [Aggregicoccus sp. 17bor-14]
MTLRPLALLLLLCLDLTACKRASEREEEEAEEREREHAAKLTEVALVPMSMSELPELTAAAPAVQQHFPGLRVRVGSRRLLAPAARPKGGATQASAEKLFSTSTGAPGDVYVVEEDLRTQQREHVFSAHDAETSRAVVSLSRLRDPAGQPTQPGAPVDAAARARATARLEFQLTAAVAQLLGVSAPCGTRECVLAPVEDVREMDARGTHLCAAHQQEVTKQIKTLAGPGQK